jgi:hypothetical protein
MNLARTAVLRIAAFAWALALLSMDAFALGLLDCEFRVNSTEPWEVEIISGEALSHRDWSGVRNPTDLPVLRSATWEITGRPLRDSDVGRVISGTMGHPDLGGPYLLGEGRGWSSTGLSFRSKWKAPRAQSEMHGQQTRATEGPAAEDQSTRIAILIVLCLALGGVAVFLMVRRKGEPVS